MKKITLLLWILLLLGAISCSKRTSSYNATIKIIDIPTNIQPQEMQNLLSKSLVKLTTESLHTNQSSLLEEMYYKEGYLFMTLKAGIRFHNGYPLSTEHLIPYLKKHKLKNYDIISERKITIKYLEEQKAQFDKFLQSSIKFYPDAEVTQTQNYFIGTDEFYLNDFGSNQIKLKSFNANPHFLNNKKRAFLFTWDENSSADLLIPFSDINKINKILLERIN